MTRAASPSLLAGLVALAAGGCYDAAPPQGAPCEPSQPACPWGQQCVQTGGEFVCRETNGTMPDAGATPDRPDADPSAFDDDSDGIPNATDNCKGIANASQANEDGDAFGDPCDPCPIGDNSDGDGDGVGDMCDPNPTVGGDQIVLFEGFADGIPSAWTATGDWSTSGGVLKSVVSGGNQNTLVTDTPASAHQTIYAQMTLTGIVGGQTGGALGVVDRNDAGATTGAMCGGVRGNGGFLGVVNAATGTAIQIVGHPFDVGTAYMLKFTRNDNNYSCVDTLNGATVGAQAAPGGTLIGLRNRVASASFGWVLVVKSP